MTVVAEPEVKQRLRTLGVATPKGVVATNVAEVRAAVAAAGLQEPLVLKAFGPAVVHKSEIGAVALGLSADTVEVEARAMAERLRSQDLEPAGFLVEEQQEAGQELIVGVVKGSFGPMVLLGLGGVLTEVLDQASLALCPLDERGARELLDGFPGAALLDGFRGSPPLDREALVDLLLGVAGAGGLVDQVGESLCEFECNPVIAGPKGAVASTPGWW